MGGNIEIQNCQNRTDIQDGRNGGHHENLQTTSAPKRCQIEPKLDGRHLDDMQIRIVKVVPFQYPRWPLWWPA